MDMNDCDLKGKPETVSSNDMVWAFDLGKGSIGGAVAPGNNACHQSHREACLVRHLQERQRAGA
jgi:hypothetical protein